MKKYIHFLLIFAVLLCACTKHDPVPVTDPGGTMKLTVQLGQPTKLAFTPDGNAIKGSWDATETISVVTLGAETDGTIVAIDEFTSTGEAGRTKAEFTGTYTGGTSPAKVIVIYPALIKSGDNYELPPYTDADGNLQKLLSKAAIGNAYFLSSTNKTLLQAINGDCSHLNKFSVATGVVNTEKISKNELTASLKNIPVIFRMNIYAETVFAGTDIDRIVIESYNNKGKPCETFNSSSWEYADIEAHGISTPGMIKTNSATLKCGFPVPADGEITAYLPVTGLNSCPAGYFWRIKTYLKNGTVLQNDKAFNTPFNPQKGYVYNIDVSYAGILE